MNGLALKLLSFLTAVFIYAQASADQSHEQAVEKGNAHYLIFCANCHGVNADGHGPLVKVLKVVPSDLTALDQTSAGESLSERVLKALDGRHEIPGDGERNMPLFSDNLEVRTIIEITEYLKTIQK